MLLKYIEKIFIVCLMFLFVFALSCGGGGGSKKNNNNLKPLAPANVTIAAGDKQITIAWDNVANAVSYNIYWANTGGVNKANGTKIANAINPYAHISLLDSTTYYYVVTSVNANGESSESNQVFATTNPAAPANVIIAAGDKQITIAWDNVANIALYNIYWANTGGVNKANGTKIANVASPYIHTNLADSTTYYYVVTSVNINGESSESNEVFATTNPPALGAAKLISPPNGAINQPSIVTLSWEGGSSNTDWLSSILGGSSIYEYKLYLDKSNPPNTVVFTSSSATFFNVNLELGVQYFWRVVISKGGQSTESEVWQFSTYGATTGPITGDNNPPFPPHFPFPEVGAKNQPYKKIKLFWTGGDKDQGDHVKYVIYFGKNKSLEATLATVDSEFFVTENLDQNTIYYWQIESVDLKGNKIRGPLWYFVTGNANTVAQNQPPYPAFNPDPFNGADKGNVSKLFFNWGAEDPDNYEKISSGYKYSLDSSIVNDTTRYTLDSTLYYETTISFDTLRFDLYLDTTLDANKNPINKVATDSLSNNYYINTLEVGKIYFWKVVVKDDHSNETQGPVWIFYTGDWGGDAPFNPSNPQPFDGEQNAPTMLNLSWTGGDPNGDMVTYDLAGDVDISALQSATPKFIKKDLPSNNFYIADTLAPNTTYFWQVTAKNSKGKTAIGPIWNFKTNFGGGPNYDGQPWVGNPMPRNWDNFQPVYISLGWDGGDPDTEDMVAFEVYLGKVGEQGAPYYRTETVNRNWTPDKLDPNTNYLWKIIAKSKKPNGNFGGKNESPIWNFITGGGIANGLNNPPFMPRDPNPMNQMNNVSKNIMLSWIGGDPDPADAMNVNYDIYLDTYPNPNTLRGTAFGNSNYWIELQENQTYYWYVLARDNGGLSSKSPVWIFKTGSYDASVNNPPFQPYNPMPTFGQMFVPLNPSLSWVGGDPDPGDMVIYEIVMDQNSWMLNTTPSIKISNLPSTSIWLSETLTPNTIYYWQIIAKDSKGSTSTSPIWSFITEMGGANYDSPPWAASPNPFDWSMNQPLYITLSWDGGDADPEDIVSYEVYFDPISEPNAPNIKTTTNIRSFTPPVPLSPNTHYIWKVKAKSVKPNGEIKMFDGPMWNFWTGASLSGNQPPFIPNSPTPGNWWSNQPTTTLMLNWIGGDPDPADYVDYTIYVSKNSNPEVDPVEVGYTYYNNMSYLLYYLSPNTTYFWQVTAKDNNDAISKSTVWTFITGDFINSPPWVNSPSPWDFAANQGLTMDLFWSAGDAENDFISYDVYFGENSLTYRATVYSQYYYIPDALLPGHTYMWQIVVSDDHNNTTYGPVWNFTTGNFTNYPPSVSSPYPSNNESNISTSLWLGWFGYDQEYNTIYYDLYFGEENIAILPLKANTGANSSFYIDGLNNDTAYKWYVVASDGVNPPEIGAMWHFTTTPPLLNNPPYKPYSPSPNTHDNNLPRNFELYWYGGDQDYNTVTYNVTVYTYVDGYKIILTGADNVNIGTNTWIGLINLSPYKTYYWQVTAFDGQVTTIGDVWDFTTGIDLY